MVELEGDSELGSVMEGFDGVFLMVLSLKVVIPHSIMSVLVSYEGVIMRLGSGSVVICEVSDL